MAKLRGGTRQLHWRFIACTVILLWLGIILAGCWLFLSILNPSRGLIPVGTIDEPRLAFTTATSLDLPDGTQCVSAESSYMDLERNLFEFGPGATDGWREIIWKLPDGQTDHWRAGVAKVWGSEWKFAPVPTHISRRIHFSLPIPDSNGIQYVTRAADDDSYGRVIVIDTHEDVLWYGDWNY